MASVNLWIGIGNLGRDPEMRYTADNTAICNFSIACEEQWKDKSGAKQTKVEWVRISTFGRLAEICGEYLKKGSQCYVQGRIQTRKWTDKEGNEKYTTEIVADQMRMLGGRRDGEADDRPASPDRPAARTSNPAPPDDLDRDIPFGPIGRGAQCHVI